MKERPVIKPSIHRVSIVYFIAHLFVRLGSKRFHRINIFSGKDKIPRDKSPFILVSNHQNGLMDALNLCSMTFTQFHWLTRADVFWNPMVRKILLSFNQLPIYRQRDRLPDIRERNDIIWDTCIERIKIGAPLALFPEGNHNPQRTIRSLKKGVSDLIGRAYTKHKSLDKMQLIPFGQDYEDYPSYRRRLALRVGDPIKWIDLYDEKTQTIDFLELNKRISSALEKLTVNIQPAEEYDTLAPYVRALRSTEKEEKDWEDCYSELKRIEYSSKENGWLAKVKHSYAKLLEAGYSTSMRPEAWGHSKSEMRPKNYLIYALKPIGWISILPSAFQFYLLKKRGERVKKIEFKSTIKIGIGVFLMPISWNIMGVCLGLLFSKYEIASFWVVFIGFWAWATIGNMLYGRLNDFYKDHYDAFDGEEFWTCEKMSNLRQAWINYIDAIKS